MTSLYAAPANERTALLIEGDDAMADLIRRLLNAEGFSLLRAASAEEALLLAPLQSLSLIILDLQLPEAEGQAFLRQLHEHSALAQVPLVLIAGLLERNLALTDGAAAVLQMPIHSAELRAALEHLGLQPDAKHSHRLLIVDDDPQAVEMIAALLPAANYSLVRAYGGREAISLAQQLQPDLILLDLLMPDVSGFDVVQELHADARTAKIPILVVTAKQVTSQDRAMLNGDSGQGIQIAEKAGLNQAQFLAEVRRALLPH
ncbi:response regulator [Pseudomonas sp.]|uniref:response regulator n=1 Tax=Pseudomonas sp. TaxID=306 RepID=UPI0035244C75